MKIKNLDITKTGFIILTSATITLCSCGDIKVNNEFEQMLDDYNIIPISQLENVPEHCYRVKVSNPVYDDGPFHFNQHWDPIDNIDNIMAIGREYDADYMVLKIEKEDGTYVIHKQTVEDINDRPEGYDYVFKDDYLIEDDSSYEDVYFMDGKVKKRE